MIADVGQPDGRPQRTALKEVVEPDRAGGRSRSRDENTLNPIAGPLPPLTEPNTQLTAIPTPTSACAAPPVIPAATTAAASKPLVLIITPPN